MGGGYVSKLAMVGRMELKNLERLFGEAARLSGHKEYVVIGSLSVLGVASGKQIPPRMLMSIDVDCYTRTDPPKVFELKEALGEASAFEIANGYFLDPVSPSLPTLPPQWEYRLVRVPFRNGITAFFLDPNDAAISKYARCDARDREWIKAGFAANLLSAPIIETRMRDTDFLDRAERDRAWRAFEEDRPT